ncbi:hypothetical protein ZWY2020_029783 [Hordeum vulgare]|nr:hypothetical protein ZWY2020_029783 [Hordeum vulgare]
MARTGLTDATASNADAMSAATKDAVDVRMISTKELQAHAAADDLWISITGDVYDVTPWLRHHPGGEVPLITLAGQDATDAFMAYHPPSMRPLLRRFFVGRLSTTPSPRLRRLPSPPRAALLRGPLRARRPHPEVPARRNVAALLRGPLSCFYVRYSVPQKRSQIHILYIFHASSELLNLVQVLLLFM